MLSIAERRAIGRKVAFVAVVLKAVGIFVLFVMSLLLLTTLCASVASSQALPPVKRVLITREAASTLDSLASKARDERVETAGCVSAYTVRDTTLTIERVGPATYTFADSVNIFTDTTGGVFRPICPVGTPSVHAHVAYGGYPVPSDRDKESQYRVGVWCLLLSVLDTGWRIIVYGTRGPTP